MSVALAVSLTVVSCVPNREEISSIQNELAALKDKVAANEADVNAQLGTLQYLLQSYKDEVNPQLVALDAQLKKDYASLSAADEALSKALKSAQSVLMTAISKNADDIAANKKDIQAAIAEYRKLVADAVAGFEAALKKAQEDQAVVDGTQDLAIDALSSQFDTCKEAIDEAINNLGESVEELAAAVEEMEGNIEDLKEKVDANFAASLAYTDALEASVKAALDALEERIAANEAAIKKLNEETIPGIENTIETLQSSIAGLEGNLPALESKKLDKEVFGAFLKEHSVWKRSTDTSIQGINESIEELKAYDAVLAGQVEYLTELVNMLNGGETVEGSVKQQIKDKLAVVYKLIMEDLSALKTDLEGKMETLENDVKGIQNVLALTWEEIAIINGNLNQAKDQITAINGQLATAEGDMQKLREAKAELENRMAALQASIESRSKAIEELVAGLKDKVDIINGDKETEGSIAYAVEQLRASVQAQLAQLPEKVSKNAQEIAKLKEEMGKLQQYIQSLVFVPQYQDLKFGIPFTKIDDVYKAYNVGAGFAVVYKVAPASLAKPLAQAVNDAIAKGIDPPFNFDIDSDLQTRATDTNPQLIIKDAVGDEGTGKITFFLSHKNFDPAGDNLDKYSISLRADNADYNVHVASKYVQAKLHLVTSISFVSGYIYRPNASTGMAYSAIKCDNKVSTNEKEIWLSYTDSKAYAPLEGYELAAQDEKGVVRTYSQWRALNFDMPEVTVTASLNPISPEINHNLLVNYKGSSTTFAVRTKIGDKDNMWDTKKEINRRNRYDFVFSDGKNTTTAQCAVYITKHPGAFQIRILYSMPWTYKLDAEVDHTNKGKDPSVWTESYVRDYAPAMTYSEDSFIATPYLAVGDELFLLDGSNNALGLEAGLLKDFNTSETLPSGANFHTVNAYENHRLNLQKFVVSKERLGKTYEYTGTYGLSYAAKSDVTKIIITTVDRKTEDIEITAPTKEVKLLDTGYSTSGDYYTLYSEDLSNTLMEKLIQQGIYTDMSQKESALSSGELHNPTVHYTASGYDKCFAPDYPGTYEYFRLKSQSTLKSDKLHKIATGSDCEGDKNPWALEIETYVGQKVKIHWPLNVVPKYNYRFVTNGQDTFQVPIGWIGGPTTITKAETELNLIRNNDHIVKVMYLNGGIDNYVDYNDYSKQEFRLVPEFSLVEASAGITVHNVTVIGALDCISNVHYYGQAPSVAVKSALYIMGGDEVTKFYVPGSDQMYVGDTPITSVTVKQANPIAATQANPVNPTTIVGGEGLVELMMQDVLGHYIYFNGQARNNTPPYSGTIASIFNAIQFSVYSVNGSTSFSGWTLKDTDTPDYVTLKTSGIAAGTYTVVIKASTVWKDYYYTVKVNVE